MLNQSNIFKTDVPPSPRKAAVAGMAEAALPSEKSSLNAPDAEDIILSASFEEHMLSASSEDTNPQESHNETDLLAVPVDLPNSEAAQTEAPLIQTDTATAPDIELAINAPNNNAMSPDFETLAAGSTQAQPQLSSEAAKDIPVSIAHAAEADLNRGIPSDVPDITHAAPMGGYSNNVVSVATHLREIPPAKDITIARPPASSTPNPWSESFVDDNSPALKPSHKPTPHTHLPLGELTVEDARLVTGETNIITKRGDAASPPPAEGAPPQAVTPSEDIDVKLADQRMIEMRHIAGQNSTADDVMKTPAIPSTVTTSPLAATQMSTAETASFALAASPSSPLSSASPLALSSPLTPLNAPSFQSVTQSIIKTLETQKGVSVRLDPPEMGRVYIDYQFESDKSVTAIVRAELPEALTQLRENTSILQNLLKDNGFENVNIDFAQSGSDSEESASDDFQEHRLSLNSESAVEGFTASSSPTAPPNLHRQYLNQSIDIKL